MRKNMRSKKKKLIFNIFFYAVALISIVIAGIFCFFIFHLDMIPEKYLTMFYVSIGIVFLILLGMIIPWKVKLRFKTISCIFLVLFSVVFCIGIKYIGVTMNFVDIINNDLSQKEEYYVMVLKNSSIKNIQGLEGKAIGVYQSVNSSKAVALLSEKVTVHEEYFDDVTDMFEKLAAKELDAVFINTSIKNLLDTDLSYMNLELNSIQDILVSIKETDIVKIVDVTNTPFNVYIAGGDAYGTINKVTNTDVNMVASIDPVNKKILLTSIPRDYYVHLSGLGTDAYDKLTHAGYYGIQESVSAVEELLDIDINYYVKVNFSTIEGVIDAIGGVDVYSDISFCAYGCPEICYQKGNNHLDGHFALMFARERHAYIDGDVQRVKNQQKVLTAIIDKVSSSTALITNYSRILDSVSNSFVTNIDTKSISRLVKMQLNDMSGWKIESQNLVGDDLYTTNTFTFPNMNLYVMQPNEESVNDASAKIKAFIQK